MSKETPTLVATKRDRLGSRYAKRLRAAGQLPANLYGHGAAPVAIALEERALLHALKHGTHVLNLAFADGGTDTVLVKDLQFGYLGDNIIHLDLARVNLDELVTVKVHLTFVGTPEAAKRPGTILVHDMSEIDVRCKVRDIPEEIKVDLSHMGDTLTVADLKLAAGLEAATEGDHIVCRVQVVKEEAAASEAAAVEGKTEPEVLTAKKEDSAADGDKAKK